MIESAIQFITLRSSTMLDEYQQAANDAAPIEVWLQIIEQYPEMRKWVAHNKTVPIAILEILAQDPDPRVRATVAAKRKAGQAILQQLAQDPDESVRMQVAINANTPSEILHQLLNDRWERIVEIIKERLDKPKELQP
jgi:hypothetical protein